MNDYSLFLKTGFVLIKPLLGFVWKLDEALLVAVLDHRSAPLPQVRRDDGGERRDDGGRGRGRGRGEGRGGMRGRGGETRGGGMGGRGGGEGGGRGGKRDYDRKSGDSRT